MSRHHPSNSPPALPDEWMRRVDGNDDDAENHDDTMIDVLDASTPDISSSSTSNIEANNRTIYGGIRVSLAQQARNILAESAASSPNISNVTATPTAAPPAHPPTCHIDKRLRRQKQQCQRDWEQVFGKHTARCHPQSLIDLFKKEGKLTFLLSLLGITASVLDYTIDIGISAVHRLHKFTVYQAELHAGFWLATLVWISFLLVFTLFAVRWTRAIDPYAAGSGIPEMKVIISGDLRREPERYLRAKTLLSKAVGLACAMGAGLSVGREGPFVHCASIIGYQLLSHISFFSRLFKKREMHRHVYSAACAVGVAATFAAPIGGVLFAIEVTSTFFLVSNYWRGFVASVSGAIMKSLLDQVRRDSNEFKSFEPLFPTEFKESNFTSTELFAFATVGVLMGLLGPIYIYSSDCFRKISYKQLHQRPMTFVTIVTLCIGMLLVFTPGVSYQRLGFASQIKELCNPLAASVDPTSVMALRNVWLGLCTSALVRLIITILSTSLPVPAGDFIPLFICGASIGRFIGHVFASVSSSPERIIPGGYALVAGAALVGSVTHTVSVAVIVLEFTGQFTYLMPMFTAVMISCGISRGLCRSNYDATLIRKGLPYLSLLRCDNEDISGFCAKDLMLKSDDLLVLERYNSSPEGIVQLIQSTNVPMSSYPLVDTDMTLLGLVTRDNLLTYVSMHQHTTSSSITIESGGGTTTENISDSPSVSEVRKRRPSVTEPLGDIKAPPLPIIPSMPTFDMLEMVEVDHSLLTVDELMPVEQIHLLFEMLKRNVIFITSRGKLVGVIPRRSLYYKLRYLNLEQ